MYFTFQLFIFKANHPRKTFALKDLGTLNSMAPEFERTRHEIQTLYKL